MFLKNKESSQEYVQEDTGIPKDFNHAPEQDLGVQTGSKQ